MKPIFLLTTTKETHNLSYTASRLTQVAEANNCQPLLVHPSDIGYFFKQNESAPLIFYQENEIGTNLCGAYLIAHRKYRNALTSLAYILRIYGWAVLDPFDGFVYYHNAKVIDVAEIYKIGLLPNTLVIFSLHVGKALLSFLRFPILAKPIEGQQGQNIFYLENIEVAQSFLKDFFSGETDKKGKGIILQEYISNFTEYRILMLNGKIIDIVQKESINILTRNAAQGIKFFKSKTNFAIIQNLLKQYIEHFHRGFIGIDLAITNSGKIFIFEINMNPEWRMFEKSTKIDVAKHIIGYLKEFSLKNNGKKV